MFLKRIQKNDTFKVKTFRMNDCNMISYGDHKCVSDDEFRRLGPIGTYLNHFRRH